MVKYQSTLSEKCFGEESGQGVGPEVYSTLTATGTAVWSPISVRCQGSNRGCFRGRFESLNVPFHRCTYDVDSWESNTKLEDQHLDMDGRMDGWMDR